MSTRNRNGNKNNPFLSPNKEIADPDREKEAADKFSTVQQEGWTKVYVDELSMYFFFPPGVNLNAKSFNNKTLDGKGLVSFLKGAIVLDECILKERNNLYFSSSEFLKQQKALKRKKHVDSITGKEPASKKRLAEVENDASTPKSNAPTNDSPQSSSTEREEDVTDTSAEENKVDASTKVIKALSINPNTVRSRRSRAQQKAELERLNEETKELRAANCALKQRAKKLENMLETYEKVIGIIGIQVEEYSSDLMGSFQSRDILNPMTGNRVNWVVHSTKNREKAATMQKEGTLRDPVQDNRNIMGLMQQNKAPFL